MKTLIILMLLSTSANAMTVGDARDLNQFNTEVVGAYTLGVYEAVNWQDRHCSVRLSYDKLLGYVVNDLQSIGESESRVPFAAWINRLINLKCG